MNAMPSSSPPALRLAEQALTRAGGTPMIAGNAASLLFYARLDVAAWRAAILAPPDERFPHN